MVSFVNIVLRKLIINETLTQIGCCIVLHCIVMYCTVLYCLCCILYCIVLYCTNSIEKRVCHIYMWSVLLWMQGAISQPLIEPQMALDLLPTYVCVSLTSPSHHLSSLHQCGKEAVTQCVCVVRQGKKMEPTFVYTTFGLPTAFTQTLCFTDTFSCVTLQIDVLMCLWLILMYT